MYKLGLKWRAIWRKRQESGAAATTRDKYVFQVTHKKTDPVLH